MMILLSDLPLGIYEKAFCSSLSWEEKLWLVKENGYDYLEINVDGTKERLARLESPRCAYELSEAIAKTGVPVYTFAFTANRAFPLGSADAERRRKGIAYLKKAIIFAHKTGIRIIHIAAYDETERTGTAETKIRFREAVEECILFASRYGVILAFETMDVPFMDTVDKIMRYVREFDSPYLQVYADIGNITAGGHDPGIDLACGGNHIVGIHLKDSKGKQIRDIAFGEGDVDFDSCLRTLKQIGYGGFFTAEMWCYDAPDFLPYLKKANQFLRAKLERW